MKFNRLQSEDDEEVDELMPESQLNEMTWRSGFSPRASNKSLPIMLCLALLVYSSILVSVSYVIADARARSQRLYGTRSLWC